LFPFNSISACCPTSSIAPLSLRSNSLTSVSTIFTYASRPLSVPTCERTNECVARVSVECRVSRLGVRAQSTPSTNQLLLTLHQDPDLRADALLEQVARQNMRRVVRLTVVCCLHHDAVCPHARRLSDSDPHLPLLPLLLVLLVLLLSLACSSVRRTNERVEKFKTGTNADRPLPPSRVQPSHPWANLASERSKHGARSASESRVSARRQSQSLRVRLVLSRRR